ncbi:hypothetical protein CTEN210_06427 [Chaetoceros tenuissimus]|uniref:RING-type E3 ubiquitin transferase n=1 Tax=Chaetoceros tenuissimus TaxID=426638 RepID=A0AAD3H4F6_9STRA|nr:hypothetical protein CTEN210_06427 [Chaetoceros tenuissimus]
MSTAQKDVVSLFFSNVIDRAGSIPLEIEKLYTSAKSLRPDEAMMKFEEVMVLENVYLEVLRFVGNHTKYQYASVKGIWFLKSLKQMIKLRLTMRDFTPAYVLYSRLLFSLASPLLEEIPKATLERSIEQIFECISSLYIGNGELRGKSSVIKAFAYRVYEVSIETFHPVTGNTQCRNQKLWFKSQLKLGEVLFELKEVQGLEAIIPRLAQYYFKENKHSSEDQLHAEILKMQLYFLKKETSRFAISSYESMKTCKLWGGLEPFTLARVHETAGEIYLDTPLNYHKPYAAFLSALEQYRICGSSDDIRCLKFLFVIKMLEGSHKSPLEKDRKQHLKLPKDEPQISNLVQLFDSFKREHMAAFDLSFNLVNETAIEKYLLQIQEKLRENILFKQLPFNSTVSITTLSNKLNGLEESAVIAMINTMIFDSRVRGKIDLITNEYVGSRCLQQNHSIISTVPNPARPKLNFVQKPVPKPLPPYSSNFFFSNPVQLSLSHGQFHSHIAKSDHEIQICHRSSVDCDLTEETLDRRSFNYQIFSLKQSAIKLIIEARERYPLFARHVDITSVDNLDQLLETFLSKHQEFKKRKVFSLIDIGYHYTKPECVSSIRRTGLRCSERGVFGPGVYTASNPTAFASKSKNVGLILLRLQGEKGRFGERKDKNRIFDTIIGNKNRGDPFGDIHDMHTEFVIQTPAQCVPIVIFDAPLGNATGTECIEYIQHSLQDLMDNSLNVPESQHMVEIQRCLPFSIFSKIRDRKKKDNVDRCSEHLLYHYFAPYRMGVVALYIPKFKYDESLECAICLQELGSDSHTLRSLSCSHIYHEECIQSSLEHSPCCPRCRKWVKEPQGKSPSGKMYIFIHESRCSGYTVNTIVIHYRMNAGIQKPYHPNPNVHHDGKNVKAYLPNNAEGKKLLKRLKYAFEHGLTFTVGTSITTGHKNQCSWASIHHKTSLDGGTAKHGYPDPSYFFNCNDELDRLGVPPADDLPYDFNF